MIQVGERYRSLITGVDYIVKCIEVKVPYIYARALPTWEQIDWQKGIMVTLETADGIDVDVVYAEDMYRKYQPLNDEEEEGD